MLFTGYSMHFLVVMHHRHVTFCKHSSQVVLDFKAQGVSAGAGVGVCAVTVITQIPQEIRTKTKADGLYMVTRALDCMEKTERLERSEAEPLVY